MKKLIALLLCCGVGFLMSCRQQTAVDDVVNMMTEAQLQEIESMAATFFDGFLNYQDKGFTLELLADEVVDEQNYRVLQVTDKHDNVKKHYINPETHFLERVSGNVPNSAGEWEPMVMTFKPRNTSR